MPAAIATGIVLHNLIGYVAFLSTYLIFIMLLITFTRLSIKKMRPDGSMIWLLIIQTAGAIAIWAALKNVNDILAQSAFICVFCPTATAAPVITRMLGGSIEKVATYSLFCNFVVAIAGAPLLALVGDTGNNVEFTATMGRIAMSVLPLILGPLIAARLLSISIPTLHKAIANHQSLSFYIWAISLIIVVGNAVSFAMSEPAETIPLMLLISVSSLLLCILQFIAGRLIGRRYGDAVAGAQSLGQKNTVLGIWLALSFLNPMSSIGPASYVLWHNLVNSWQIWHFGRIKIQQ